LYSPTAAIQYTPSSGAAARENAAVGTAKDAASSPATAGQYTKSRDSVGGLPSAQHLHQQNRSSSSSQGSTNRLIHYSFKRNVSVLRTVFNDERLNENTGQ